MYVSNRPEVVGNIAEEFEALSLLGITGEALLFGNMRELNRKLRNFSRETNVGRKDVRGAAKAVISIHDKVNAIAKLRMPRARAVRSEYERNRCDTNSAPRAPSRPWHPDNFFRVWSGNFATLSASSTGALSTEFAWGKTEQEPPENYLVDLNILNDFIEASLKAGSLELWQAPEPGDLVFAVGNAIHRPTLNTGEAVDRSFYRAWLSDGVQLMGRGDD